jgi:lipid II:glycine glycyltransferase (peptidoglycan interpeptide bridge formation enzyme)
MLKQYIKKGPFTKTDYWFNKEVKLSFLSNYFQSSYDGSPIGMKKSEFYTIHINLQDELEEIKQNFDKGTAYEIRRAVKDGITSEASEDKDAFIKFYNTFAEAKGIEGTSVNYNMFENEIIITKAIFEGEDLVMHSYITDKIRARLYMSCSKYLETEDKTKRALLGRANRYLHFKDIEMFKMNGLKFYDFGGYTKDTENKYLIGINKFKLGFGGKIITEYNYSPFWR